MELNPHATEQIFHTAVLANKMELFVHSTTHNASYIHPSHNSILELWRTFPNAQLVNGTYGQSVTVLTDT